MIVKSPTLAVSTALAVIAAGCAAWFAGSWYSAAQDNTAKTAALRDTVLAAGEQAIENMNTLDYHNLDAGFARWEQSTTGTLLQQLQQGKSQFEQLVQQAQTVTTAKVLSGAVTELDAGGGKASVMVAISITVQSPKNPPSTKQSSLLGDLTRTSSGWKLSGLGQAPAGASPTPSATPSGTSTPTPSATATAGR